jgi:hypothetical protein
MDSQNRSLSSPCCSPCRRPWRWPWCRTNRLGAVRARRLPRRDARNVANALAIFALGLPSFVMIKVFSPAYFAREDTQTPMRYAAISLTANTVGSDRAVLAVRLARLMPHLGIAVATTLGGWLNAVLLYRTLCERAISSPTRAAADAADDPAVERDHGRRLWLAAIGWSPGCCPTQGVADARHGAGDAGRRGLLVYAVAILARARSAAAAARLPVAHARAPETCLRSICTR